MLKSGYSVETCAACDAQFCQKHIQAVVRDEGVAWMCRRCVNEGREPKHLLKVASRTVTDLPRAPGGRPGYAIEPERRRRLTCQVCPPSRRANDAEHICPDCGRWICTTHSTVKVSAGRDSVARVCQSCAEVD